LSAVSVAVKMHDHHRVAAVASRLLIIDVCRAGIRAQKENIRTVPFSRHWLLSGEHLVLAQLSGGVVERLAKVEHVPSDRHCGEKNEDHDHRKDLPPRALLPGPTTP